MAETNRSLAEIGTLLWFRNTLGDAGGRVTAPWGRAVLEYKIYRLDQRGKISAPPEIVTSDQEPAVVEKARSMAEGCDIEVWQGERLVVHVSQEA